MSRPKSPPEGKFWALVDKEDPSGCWVWLGCVNNKGYGQFNLNGTGNSPVLAHRYSFHLEHPEFKVVAGMKRCILHACDNRRCVNPAHLFVGTAKQNTHDMLKKGRWHPATGERSGQHKLTWGIVHDLRKEYPDKGGRPVTMLCKKYGVSKSALTVMFSGKSWKESNYDCES